MKINIVWFLNGKKGGLILIKREKENVKNCDNQEWNNK